MKENLNNTLLGWIIVILIINTILLSFKTFKVTSQKFEYKIEYLDDSSYSFELNKLGSDGWQVVGSRRATSSGEYGYELILMRSR